MGPRALRAVTPVTAAMVVLAVRPVPVLVETRAAMVTAVMVALRARVAPEVSASRA